jgi:hypothetical protein
VENKEEQKRLITEIMEADAKDGLYKEQTAIEWLLEQWPILVAQIPPQIIDQAKEKEEKQINDACYHGYYTETPFDVRTYYKTTYGREED